MTLPAIAKGVKRPVVGLVTPTALCHNRRAVAVLLGGASVAKTMWFNTKRNGSLAVLKIDGKQVTRVGEVEVGGLPEGAVFSPDGKYLYVGNYTDRDVSILKVDGTRITDTGKKLKLPGQPASMRGRTQ